MAAAGVRPAPVPASSDSSSRGATAAQNVGAAAKGGRITQAFNQGQTTLKATQTAKDGLTAAFETNNAAGINALLKAMGKTNPTAADQALARGIVDTAAKSTADHIATSGIAVSSNTALITNQETVFFENQLSAGLKKAMGNGANDEQLAAMARAAVEGNNAAVEITLRAAFTGLNLTLHAVSTAFAGASLGMDVSAAVKIYEKPNQDWKKEAAIGTAVGLDTVATLGTGAAALSSLGALPAAGTVLLSLAAPEIVIPVVVVGAIASWWAQE